VETGKTPLRSIRIWLTTALPRLNIVKLHKISKFAPHYTVVLITIRFRIKPMKKLTSLVISSLLLFGAAACGNDTAKTSESAPNNPTVAPSETPNVQATQAAEKDAQSQTRRDQLNADIRAREQRNNEFNSGSATNRAEDSLASEVRSKLEANIPNGHLTVKSTKDGIVTVAGTVTNEQQLAKIAPLAKQIKGVNSVVVNAKVAKAKS
jgi:osmotically-inducible protein OsmY